MAVNRIDVNPDLIKKAIIRAGLDPDDYAAANPQIGVWLNGEQKPTVKQLEEFAQKFHIPFGYFFLDDFPTRKHQFLCSEKTLMPKPLASIYTM